MSLSVEPRAGLILLLMMWAAYFAIHSLLASIGVKQRVAARWPRAMAGYRLGYNLLAVILLVPPLWLTLTWPGPMLWEWQGAAALVADGLAAVAALLFLWSLRFYDGAEFIGLRQLRDGATGVADQESFKVSPLHRYVRHPWYSLGLVLLWTRDMDAARLLAVLVITLYFVVGSRLEERKLRAYHGPVYDRFRERVPALVPRPWRRLSRAEAARLEAG